MSAATKIMETPMWGDRRLSAVDRAVLIVLAHLTRGATIDEPVALRRPAIATAAGVSERTAQRSITTLRRLGYVHAKRGTCDWTRRPALLFRRVVITHRPAGS